MKYVSTRGHASDLTFTEALLTGLAPDGGLYLPNVLPQVSPETLTQWQHSGYEQLATDIFQQFAAGSALDSPELSNLIHAGLDNFRHGAIAPLVQLDDGENWLLELFYGPTLAFKDYALQILGQLIGHLLGQTGEHITVLGATSGDTGAAAIAGMAGVPNAQIFILHPKGSVSEVQRRQMTTCIADNIHNIAIEGSFDDCQDLVKQGFRDETLRQSVGLTAINSINIARIVAQMVYYVQASLRLGGSDRRPIHFCVPTGNFGNIFSAYLAKQLGAPIGQLVIASNRNDILPRSYREGTMVLNRTVSTLSMSMDIQIPSNFERLLYLLVDRDAETLCKLLQDFRAEGECHLPAQTVARWHRDFLAYSVDDELTKTTIADVYQRNKHLIDPHTAVGVAAARQARAEGLTGPLVSLACAHPAKFPTAVRSATAVSPELPDFMADLFEREERLEVLPNSFEALKQRIQSVSG
ncbi:MAG: threonine synthase [Elainellaceae cyanobacterium]